MGILLFFTIMPLYCPFALAICLLSNLLKQVTSSCLLPSTSTPSNRTQGYWWGSNISAFFPHTTFMHHLHFPLVTHFSATLSVKGCPRPNGEWRELILLMWSLLFWCIFFNLPLMCWKLLSWTIHWFSLPAEWRSCLSCSKWAKEQAKLKVTSIFFLSRCVPGLCWVANLIFHPQVTQRNFQSHIMHLDAQIILGLFSDARVCVWIFCFVWKFQPKEQNKGEGLQT